MKTTTPKKGNIAYRTLSALISFSISNLDILVLCLLLQLWFDAGNTWEYWATIALMIIADAIATHYKRVKKISITTRELNNTL